MKKTFFFGLLLMFVSIACLAQKKNIIETKKEENVFIKVEIESGPDARAWAEHISKNIQLPDSLSKTIPAGVYKISVRFVVDIHGNIGQVEAKNDPGYGLAARAVKIIKSYKGEWKPAIQCGRAVKSYKTQPVVFEITD